MHWHRNARTEALVLMLLPVALPQLSRAQNGVVEICPPPAVTLARFVANQQNRQWPEVESLEIEASLPRLNKSGRLSAIRRIRPAETPQYEVLQSSGDTLVKREIMVRYLSADARTIEVLRESTGITPANYRFRYVGIIDSLHSPVYVFRITPRKKRVGLINGVIWLDGATGIAVRIAGSFVRMPSVFVRRVNVTRENDLCDATVESSVTHLLVETRVAGPAQLLIFERPLVPSCGTCDGRGRPNGTLCDKFVLRTYLPLLVLESAF